MADQACASEAQDFLSRTAPYRAFLYRFWSQFFLGRLTPDWLAALTDAAKVEAVLEAGRDLDASAAVPDPLGLEREGEGLILETLKQDFARLFYGVGCSTAPLTMSASQTTEKLLSGPLSARVREVYVEHGLVQSREHEASEDGVECLPDDHLGIMLGFLAELAERNDGGAERQFLRDWVQSWWPQAAREAMEALVDQEKPMRRLLDAFSRFLEAEAKCLDVAAAVGGKGRGNC